MSLVLFNASLYIVYLLYYHSKHKNFNYYSLVLLIYTATACICAYNFTVTTRTWTDLSIFPFIYLFGILLLFMHPLKDFEFSNLNISIDNNRYIRFFGTLYLVVGLINIGLSIKNTTELINSGDWATIYNDFYEDEENYQLYDSTFQKLVKNLTSYLSPFAYIYLFYLLTREKLSTIYITLFTISTIAPAFISASTVASRGMLMFVAVKLAISYILFREKIPSNRKKVIAIVASGIFGVFLLYIIAVTLSRFGEDDSTKSIVDYFGHSMLSFNDGIFNNLHEYAWGKRFFKWFIDFFGGNSYFNIAKAGATHGNAFFTFVGGVYIDWGPIGTIVAGFIVCQFINRFFHRQTLHLSDCIIIVFYVDFLANGIYAYMSGRALLWAMTFFLYLIIKKIETRND